MLESTKEFAWDERRASRLWADYVRRVLEDDGSETIVVFCMVSVNGSKRYIVGVWGGDSAFTVASEMLPHLNELLERNFECKLNGNIGPKKPLKVVKLLNPQRAWTEQGFEWRADTKHSPEAWSRGWEEHERGESPEQGVRYEHPRRRGLPRCAGGEGVRQHCGDLALPRFGRPGLPVRGGPVDVGGHKAAAEAPGHDEALLKVHGRAMVLRMEARLPRVARRAGDLD